MHTLIKNPSGQYSFLQGIAPYSAGAVAEHGYEIEHAKFLRPVPLKAGFDRVRAHLGSISRPVAALCGLELRSPRPFSFQGFNEFNSSYVGILKSWGLFVNGANPVARTNVAAELDPVAEPCIYGFSYTVRSQRSDRTFVVAGGGELPEGSLDPHDVVRRGEVDADAIREKARFVMDLMAGRLEGMGVSWDHATAINVYTVHSLCSGVSDDVLEAIGGAQVHGLTWYFARPPIVSIEYEMDVRGCRRELVLPA